MQVTPKSKIIKQSVKEKQYKLLKKTHRKSNQPGQNASNTNTKNSKDQERFTDRDRSLTGQRVTVSKNSKTRGLK